MHFDILELEEAQKHKKDLSSRSRIICWKRCFVGPKETSKSPMVTNLVNMIMLGLNFATLFYGLKGSWRWLVSINILIGFLA